MPDPSQIPYVNLIKNAKTPTEIQNVPILGELYGTANAIITFAESDCNPNWSVYAETLFPAAGTAVLALLDFGLDDILRGYFRPKGGRGFGGLGHGKRRLRRPTKAQRARGLLGKGIPEVGELLGRNIPGARAVQARHVSNAERFLWRVDGIAQRGLWYWLIADITEEFTINWTTAIMRSTDCAGGQAGGAIRNQPLAGIPFGLSPVAIQCQNEEEEWGVVESGPGTYNIPAGYSGWISGFGTYREFLPDLGTIEIGIRNASTGVVTKWISEGREDPATGEWEIGGGGLVQGPAVWQMVTRNSGNLAVWNDFEITCVANATGT